jgi:hypothetical protein
MIGQAAVNLLHQASFPVLDAMVWLTGALIVGFLALFVAYVLVLRSSGWPGARSRTIVGVVGIIMLLVLGVPVIFLAVALLATAYLAIVVTVVLACFGYATLLLRRHLRRPAGPSSRS